MGMGTGESAEGEGAIIPGERHGAWTSLLYLAADLDTPLDDADAQVLSHLMPSQPPAAGLSAAAAAAAPSASAVGIAQLRLIAFGDFMTPGQEPKR